MVPFEVPIKCFVVGHIRNPTARLLHRSQGGLIQLSSLLQPHLPLHPLHSLGGRHHRLEATAFQRVHVAKPFQITLAGKQRNHINDFVHRKNKTVLSFLSLFNEEGNIFLLIMIWMSVQVITSLHSLIAHIFGNLTPSRQNEPSATHFCQLRISHVFDDVSWEGDIDGLEGKAPSVLNAYPQN